MKKPLQSVVHSIQMISYQMNNAFGVSVEIVQIQMKIMWIHTTTHANGMSVNKIYTHAEHVIQTSLKPKKCVVLVNVMKLVIEEMQKEILVPTMTKIQMNVIMKI